MAQIDKLPIPPFQNGMIREAALDENLVPNDTVELSLNLHSDRIGALQLRPGITLLGARVASDPILGMTNFINNAHTISKAIAKSGTVVYGYAGSTWDSIRTGLSSTSKARFTNFVNRTYMVNGNANQAIASYTGTGSFTDNANTGSLPKGDFIENYRSRIWDADSSTDKVYYSDVVATDGTISGGTSFIQISPQDGERITGLKRYPRALLVFKNNHIYRIFSTDSVDPDPSIFRGTYSQESIVEGKNGISYHHPSGFYDFVFDGDQKEISRPIVDIINAIPRTMYENIIGWADDNNKYWSIGDITLKGVLFENLVCRYTISTQVWAVYSYNQQITASTKYDDFSSITNIIGNELGEVLTHDSGNTDNGTPIYYDLITHPMYFTSVKSSVKAISGLATIHENAQGGNVSYQIDTDPPNKWRPISEIKKDLYQIDSLNTGDFTRIRFRLSGSSTGSPFIFRGWEILNMITQGEIMKP